MPRIRLTRLNHKYIRRVNRPANRLEYFPNRIKSETGVEPSGFILLENLKSVRKFDETSIQIDAGVDGVLLLRNDSQALLQYWIDELNRYITSYRVSYTASTSF
jgi:predicted AAA+ superfamily ATPase